MVSTDSGPSHPLPTDSSHVQEIQSRFYPRFFSSIQGVELERLMVLFILASNVFLIGVIFSGFIADSKNQIKAFGILRLLPGDIIIDPDEIKGEQRQPTSSDLLLLLQLAKTGLRDMHPVFALCLQVFIWVTH